MAGVGGGAITMELLTPVNIFKLKVMGGISRHINNTLLTQKTAVILREKIKNIIRLSLENQPEYISMVDFNGTLRRELGVVDSRSAMEELTNIWIDSLRIFMTKSQAIGNKLTGEILIKAIDASFQDVLLKDFSFYSYNSKKLGGQITIPWLDWLLTRGNEMLVFARVEQDPKFSKASRTGTNTIMIKTEGKAWGVPAEYSGTLSNNFCTRAIVGAMPEINKAFVEILKSTQ